MTESEHSKLRFIESMPKPLMALFGVLAFAAIGISIVVFFTSVGETVAIEERRPPPRGTYSHDVGRITPGPLGEKVPSLPPACDAVRETKLVASGNGVLRLRRVLDQVCRLVAGGTIDDATTAARALAGVTVRFGSFSRTGVESTVDFATKTIWLNTKFAISTKPIEELTPVVLHEAFHIARSSDDIDIDQELRARRVEAAACREFIDIEEWPRWCKDARALTQMSETSARTLLARAGYSA